VGEVVGEIEAMENFQSISQERLRAATQGRNYKRVICWWVSKAVDCKVVCGKRGIEVNGVKKKKNRVPRLPVLQLMQTARGGNNAVY